MYSRGFWSLKPALRAFQVAQAAGLPDEDVHARLSSPERDTVHAWAQLNRSTPRRELPAADVLGAEIAETLAAVANAPKRAVMPSPTTHTILTQLKANMVGDVSKTLPLA